MTVSSLMTGAITAVRIGQSGSSHSTSAPERTMVWPSANTRSACRPAHDEWCAPDPSQVSVCPAASVIAMADVPSSARRCLAERSAPAVQEWLKKYQAKYGQPGSLYGAYAYAIVQLAGESLRRAGPNLTVDSLVKGTESIKDYKTIFGGPTIKFSDKDHMGMRGSLLFKVDNGRWVQVGGELTPVVN